MRQLNELAQERETMSTVVELTDAFEGIASMHISQIKDQVLASQSFFGELWRLYTKIRVDQQFHYGRRGFRVANKELIIVVTAEGSFSGDIDHQVISNVIKIYDPAKYDVMVVGTHGAAQLLQNNIHYVRSFRLPISDRFINVAPLVAAVGQYKSTTVFHPTYVSLTNQQVKAVQMSALVAEKGQDVKPSDDIIAEENYIFEPSVHAVVDHLERSMLNIMLGEIILESKLAQYASRFRAMHSARDKANETLDNLTISYNRAKRLLKDERAKEITNGLRKVRA